MPTLTLPWTHILCLFTAHSPFNIHYTLYTNKPKLLSILTTSAMGQAPPSKPASAPTTPSRPTVEINTSSTALTRYDDMELSPLIDSSPQQTSPPPPAPPSPMFMPSLPSALPDGNQDEVPYETAVQKYRRLKRERLEREKREKEKREQEKRQQEEGTRNAGSGGCSVSGIGDEVVEETAVQRYRRLKRERLERQKREREEKESEERTRNAGSGSGSVSGTGHDVLEETAVQRYRRLKRERLARQEGERLEKEKKEEERQKRERGEEESDGEPPCKRPKTRGGGMGKLASSERPKDKKSVSQGSSGSEPDNSKAKTQAPRKTLQPKSIKKKIAEEGVDTPDEKEDSGSEFGEKEVEEIKEALSASDQSEVEESGTDDELDKPAKPARRTKLSRTIRPMGLRKSLPRAAKRNLNVVGDDSESEEELEKDEPPSPSVAKPKSNHAKRRCQETRADGEACKLPPQKDNNYCHMHNKKRDAKGKGKK